jgi:hypothetical protein
MEKYFGLRIHPAQAGALKYKFPNGTVQMPCGHVGAITGRDQPCPNSGRCPQGHGECWIEQYIAP